MRRSVLVPVLLALAMVSTPVASQPLASGDHPTDACSEPYHVQWAQWDLCWQRDDLRVQGLEVNQVYFQNDSVAWKMGVPFSLTQYELGTKFKDVLGTPNAAGVPGFGKGSMAIDDEACPRFEDKGRLLDDDRVCVELRKGIEPAVTLWSTYNAYNYRFLQGWTFHDTGVIEPFVMLGGHLIDGPNVGANGANHYHHIYWRLDLDIAAPGNDTFQVFQHTPTGGSGAWVVPAGTDAEVQWRYEQRTHDKYRIVDFADRNAQQRGRSFELLAHSDAPSNEFSTIDAMNLQFKGDSREIGHEVSQSPPSDYRLLLAYMTPPEQVDDPVTWAVHHTYHDTRDEDRRSMVPHYLSIKLRSYNFANENPTHDTYPKP